MFFRARLAALFLVFSLVFVGCSRQEKPALERIAIVPFENLSSDPSLDWISRASAGVLGDMIGRRGRVQAFQVGSEREATSQGFSDVLQGYFYLRNGQIICNGAIRDLKSNKTIQTVAASGSYDRGLLPVFTALAREMNPTPRAYSTKNESALREYFQALSASSSDGMSAHLDAAIQADPSFGTAYIARIEALQTRGDKEAVANAIHQADTAEANFSPYDQARLNLLKANISGDLEQKARATTEMARLEPNNIDIRKNLAEFDLARKDYKGAAQALEEAARINPQDASLWNSLGYARAYTGDVDGALKAFAEYSRLAPNDANALDSTAEVLFYAGRFADAEKNFLAAHAKNSKQFAGIELYRAALASLLAGDVKKAELNFGGFLDYRKQIADPLAGVETAVWRYQSGHPKQAFDAAGEAASGSGGNAVVSLAHAQLSLFYLDTGDRTQAAAEARAALQSAATSPVARNLAGVCAFLSQPSASASDWNARAARLNAGPAQHRLMQELLGSALLFDRHFQEAVPVWRDLYNTSSPAGSSLAAINLAWALSETGEAGEAAKIIKAGIIPPRAPEPGLESLSVSRYIALRNKSSKI